MAPGPSRKRKPAPARRRNSSAHPAIGPAQLQEVLRDGPAVVRWQRTVGIGEARSRCISMVVAGLAPFVGWIWFDWTPTTMLLFLAVDVVAVLLADLIKLLIAYPALRRTHTQDHRAQHILGIVGGIRDGTNTYVATGRGVSPLLLFLFAIAFGAVAIGGIAAGIDALGLQRINPLDEDWFVWMAAGSVVLHVVPALAASTRTRIGSREDAALYLDSGGVLGLGAGLLVLIWLPLTMGGTGTLLLLVVLFLFRLGFGLFALYYIPSVSRDLERYLRNPVAETLRPQGPAAA
jgi:hypothetical protein